LILAFVLLGAVTGYCSADVYADGKRTIGSFVIAGDIDMNGFGVTDIDDITGDGSGSITNFLNIWATTDFYEGGVALDAKYVLLTNVNYLGALTNIVGDSEVVWTGTGRVRTNSLGSTIARDIEVVAATGGCVQVAGDMMMGGLTITNGDFVVWYPHANSTNGFRSDATGEWFWYMDATYGKIVMMLAGGIQEYIFDVSSFDAGSNKIITTGAIEGGSIKITGAASLTATNSQLLDAIDSTGFYRITGDTLEGPMNGGGQIVTNVGCLYVTNLVAEGISATAGQYRNTWYDTTDAKILRWAANVTGYGQLQIGGSLKVIESAVDGAGGSATYGPSGPDIAYTTPVINLKSYTGLYRYYRIRNVNGLFEIGEGFDYGATWTNRLEIQNSRVAVTNATLNTGGTATFPASPKAGDIAYHSTSNKHYGWNGSSWDAFATTGAITNPAAPSAGDMLRYDGTNWLATSGTWNRDEVADYDYNTLLGDLSVTGAWTEVDMSGIIPENVKKVSIRLVMPGAAVNTGFWLKPYGQTNSVAISGGRVQVNSVSYEVPITVDCSSNRIMQYFHTATSGNVQLIVTGGWY